MSTPVKASDVQAKAVDWLWGDRIPRKTLTVVGGKPDQGKGLFSAYVTAEVTKRGGRVLYSAIEDDHGMMTRPRLEAAGANLDRVLLWRFQLPTHQLELRQKVIKHKIDLIVIDPFAAHLSGGVSRFSDNIRTVLTPLQELAEETGCAILITEHALKRVSEHAHPLNALGGSGSGLPAAARMAFLLGVDPDDSDRRILAPIKSNLRISPRALAYEVDVDTIELATEDTIDMAYLVSQGEVDFDARRLLTISKPGARGRPPDKREAACEWLTDYLYGKGGQSPARGLLEDSKQFGLTGNTLRRAADDLGVIKHPPQGGKNVQWILPPRLRALLKLPAWQQPMPNPPPPRGDVE